METNGDDLAYPTQMLDVELSEATWLDGGLTKREYFAAMAMQGLLSTNGSYFPDTQFVGELTAKASVKYADALIKALNENKEQS